MSTVVMLNGVSSAGKSSTAKALQQLARTPMLHVAMDAFIEMLPPRLIGEPDGMVFEPRAGAQPPVTDVLVGPAAAQLFAGMRRAIAALAEAGADLVVDEVLLGSEAEADYRALLHAHRLLLVGVVAPIELIEARERARGDRMVGLARGQLDIVHAGRRYDLEIDTTQGGPEAAAGKIAEAFGL